MVYISPTVYCPILSISVENAHTLRTLLHNRRIVIVISPPNEPWGPSRQLPYLLILSPLVACAPRCCICMLARDYRARAAAFLLSLCTAGSFSSSRKAAVARGVQRPSTWLGLGLGVGLGLGLGLALALGLK